MSCSARESGPQGRYPLQSSSVVDDAEQDLRDDHPVPEYAGVTEEWQRNLDNRVALDVEASADGVVRERVLGKILEMEVSVACRLLEPFRVVGWRADVQVRSAVFCVRKSNRNSR